MESMAVNVATPARPQSDSIIRGTISTDNKQPVPEGTNAMSVRFYAPME
jgi:hypothetical protein